MVGTPAFAYEYIAMAGRPAKHQGLIAQLVERCVRNAEVRGSNPRKSTILRFGYKAMAGKPKTNQIKKTDLDKKINKNILDIYKITLFMSFSSILN